MTDTIYLVLFFLISSAAFTVCENRNPIRAISRSRTLGLEIFMIIWSVSWSGALLILTGKLFVPWNDLRPIFKGLSQFEIFIIFFMCADFLKFTVHVLMHRKSFWCSHRLHHMPQQLHWLSGNRSSLIMLILHFAPIGVLVWFFNLSPIYIFLNSLLNILWNHIMHANIRVPRRISSCLEWLVVTPDVHHIHHATQKECINKNYGSILTIWDRIFGTYCDPKSINANNLSFGDLSPSDKEVSLKVLIGI